MFVHNVLQQDLLFLIYTKQKDANLNITDMYNMKRVMMMIMTQAVDC